MEKKDYRHLNRAQLALELRKQIKWLKAEELKCVYPDEINEHISLIEEIERRVHFGELCEAKLQARKVTYDSAPRDLSTREPQEFYTRFE